MSPRTGAAAAVEILSASRWTTRAQLRVTHLEENHRRVTEDNSAVAHTVPTVAHRRAAQANRAADLRRRGLSPASAPLYYSCGLFYTGALHKQSRAKLWNTAPSTIRELITITIDGDRTTPRRRA